MKRFFTGRSSPTFLLGLLLTLPPAAMPAADDDIDKGRYLVTIAGCNDCHTDGWAATNGRVSEDDWLTGSAIGWRGPWGTTYASNLRLLVSGMPEDAWTLMLKTRTDRPPMPWMNRFIRHSR